MGFKRLTLHLLLLLSSNMARAEGRFDVGVYTGITISNIDRPVDKGIYAGVHRPSSIETYGFTNGHDSWRVRGLSDY